MTDRKKWGWIIAAGLYLLAVATLSPLSSEIFVTEKLRLFNQGLKPFMDFEWFYGILPMAVYGLPMRWLGESLIVQRLISVGTALVILWQADSFLREQGVGRFRALPLALIALVSTAQQYCHSHTLVTLCAVVVGRLLGREGPWRTRHLLAAIACGVTAVCSKPLFGGAALCLLTPCLALWLKRMRPMQFAVFIAACPLGVILVGALVTGQPLWLEDWYVGLQSGRSDEILQTLKNYAFLMRLEYVNYFFVQGISLRSVQTYLSFAFPLLVFDLSVLSALVCMAFGRLRRSIVAFTIITLGVSAQVLITGEISLLGYAQEILPLAFILTGLIAHEMRSSWIGKGMAFVLAATCMVFGARYGSAFYFEGRHPMGSGAFKMIHLLPSDARLVRLGDRLGDGGQVMSLGNASLLFPTWQAGLVNLGAIATGFSEPSCFKNPVTDRVLLQVLALRKPELLLIARESLDGVRSSRSLSWIHDHYEPLVMEQAIPAPAEILILKRKGAL